MSQQHKQLFVYGTLKEGFHNHYLLKDATFLGKQTTLGNHKMISLGGFPGVIWRNGVHQIQGEVYEVHDEDTRVAIDNLEGYPNFYTKQVIATDYGMAEMYVLSEEFLLTGEYAHQQPVNNGEWRHDS